MMTEVSSVRPSRLTLVLGLVFFLGSAYFYQDPEWNGNSRLALTRAIVEQGSLSIDAYHEAPGWATGDKAYFGGHYYSDKAMGASILAVPVYYLVLRIAGFLGLGLTTEAIKHLLTTAVMGGTFALAGMSMFSISRMLGRRPWPAALLTVCVGFGTMLWPYSAVFYGHVPAAAFLICAFALLVSASLDAPGVWGPKWFWMGFAVGMAFICDFTSALVIVILAAYALHVLRGLNLTRKFRRAWPTFAGLLLPVSIFLAYNMAIYKTPVAFGYSYEAETRFQEIMSLGLMGMRLPTASATFHISIDPQFGLFWLSPVLLLALFGYGTLLGRREYVGECVVSFLAIAVVFLMNAASHLWYGGSAFGPRLLISALPFFIVPISLLPRRWLWLVAIMGIISAVNMLIPLLGKIQYTRLEFRPDRGGFFVDGALFNGFSLLYGYGLGEVTRLQKLGLSPWTLGAAFGWSLWSSVLVFVLAETTLMLSLWKLGTRHEGTQSRSAR